MIAQPIKHRVCVSNGSKVDARDYGILATNLFYKIVDEVRKSFIIHMQDPENFQGEVYVGSRFKSDHHVYLTLISNFPQDKFLAEPITCIYDALQNCAERDWFYQHEKEWADRCE